MPCYDKYELFYGPDNESKSKALQRQLLAKQICNSCAFVQECLEESFNHEDFYGVRAGLDGDTRRQMYNRMTREEKAG